MRSFSAALANGVETIIFSFRRLTAKKGEAFPLRADIKLLSYSFRAQPYRTYRYCLNMHTLATPPMECYSDLQSMDKLIQLEDTRVVVVLKGDFTTTDYDNCAFAKRKQQYHPKMAVTTVTQPL